jgi:hypothetical protein
MIAEQRYTLLHSSQLNDTVGVLRYFRIHESRSVDSESFPGKPHHLLAVPVVERAGNTQIVSFTPNGRAFKIQHPNAYVKDMAIKLSETRRNSLRDSPNVQ